MDILTVKDLKKYFTKKSGLFGGGKRTVKAVDGVSFSVPGGSTFGLVGESGSGKTTVARMIAGILSPDSGEVSKHGGLDMVFQDPFSSLNPRMTVMQIVGETLLVRKVPPREIIKAVKETLALVNLPGDDVPVRYPHQFSGGERQRIAIARALIRRPEIIVLDEPVSSLDVSIQAGILNLLKDLQEKLGLTYILISHDLRVIEFMADTVAVMKEGRIVECASSEQIYRSPGTDYTRRLLAAIPNI